MKSNIKIRRKIFGYTQTDLAYMCSVSRNTICSIERGEYIPGGVLLVKLDFILYHNEIRSLLMDEFEYADLIQRMNDIYTKYHPEECL